MTTQDHQAHRDTSPAPGSVAGLISSIGTLLTFSGTVTESRWMAGFGRGLSNRRLQIEDHGVRVKTIVGSGWADNVHNGDEVTVRGPIKGYEIGVDGLTIVLARTRPITHTPADPHEATPVPAWPPTGTARVRRRLRSHRTGLLRPDTTHTPTPPEVAHGQV